MGRELIIPQVKVKKAVLSAEKLRETENASTLNRISVNMKLSLPDENQVIGKAICG